MYRTWNGSSIKDSVTGSYLSQDGALSAAKQEKNTEGEHFSHTLITCIVLSVLVCATSFKQLERARVLVSVRNKAIETRLRCKIKKT